MKFIKSTFAFANLFKLRHNSRKITAHSWFELNEFSVIINTIYNVSSKSNLENLKSNSKILQQKADTLTIESMPAEFRNPKTIETLVALKKQTKLISEIVQQHYSEINFNEALLELNEIFQKISKLCSVEKK